MGAEVRSCLSLCIYFIHFPEPSVRAELMEQVPHIAMYCHQYPEYLHQAVPSHLLPLVVTFLTDTNNQVPPLRQHTENYCRSPGEEDESSCSPGAAGAGARGRGGR